MIIKINLIRIETVVGELYRVCGCVGVCSLHLTFRIVILCTFRSDREDGFHVLSVSTSDFVRDTGETSPRVVTDYLSV